MKMSEKARLTLEAAAMLQTNGGIALEDWSKVAALLSISTTQAMVSVAESLQRLADAHGTKEPERPEPPPALDPKHKVVDNGYL